MVETQELIDMLTLVESNSFRPDMKPISQNSADMFDANSKAIKLILTELINLRQQTKILMLPEHVESECISGCYPINESKTAWITNDMCCEAWKHMNKEQDAR